ncbi:heme lyase CcmF/NrfE family subunit [Sphingomonas morindae]|uniref:Heme lyase CcmF/NrfE family subunit n=1 Tax=Sphingomonas morindae TaxID=1541170 RepID=A0ABY4X6K8_9SPHN|nr:heme lyase CcmF/NrfE family subunit [Sphingomonas morindae]USI72484.1 heme lyase CcmF/NrfE family subunit [Sphingomonas morindae]
MIAEAGLIALWIAASFAALQTVLGFAGLRAPAPPRLLGGISLIQAVATLAAFAALLLLFARTDLSVRLVAAESASTLPLLYRVAGAWGNHEGSMLLWVTILAVSGAAVALFERRLAAATLAATIGAQGLIALGFFGFLLFASNPFARLDPAAPAGLGFNPLLQDPGLAFHPPTLYVGYVGLSVAFSFAVGALLARDVGPAFARAMRPWVLGAWTFLTLGITAGSYWAYYELGWGGWWFWDPTENASLMPWLAATALLHSVTVLATRDGLRAWTVMLAVVAFSMSMVGTFLVRSGILTSVHAFALDPRRGGVILLLLAFYVGGALALFATRIATVQAGAQFRPVSREGALVANNLLLSALLGVVLIGTLYPLAAEALTGEKLSVGPPYFNATAGPLALLLVATMAAGPLMRWRREEARALARRLVVPGLVLAAALLASFWAAPDLSILPRLGLTLAAGLAVASVAPLAGRRLRRTPLFTWGMVLAHLGCAVSLAGMASESGFSAETLAAARPGETLHVGPFAVRFDAVDPVAGPNWTAVRATLAATRGGAGAALRLAPEQRTFDTPPRQTSESAIATLWDGQLYTVLGERVPDGRWQVRLWWKPFVTLIWAGGALIALGGVLALIGRARPRRRPAPEREGFAPWR